MRGTNCSGRPGTTSTWPWKITTGPSWAPTVAAMTGTPLWTPSLTSISRASNQPLTNPAAVWMPSIVEVSYVIRRSESARSCTRVSIGTRLRAPLGSPSLMDFDANGTSDGSRRDRVRELAGSDAGKAAGIAVAQLCANAVALAFVVVFARILGDDGYGSLGSLLSLFLILYVPGQALQVAVAREVSARVAKGDPDPGAGVRRWIERLLVITVVVTVVSIFARDALAAVIAVEDYPWAAAAAPVGACIWMILSVERGAMQAFARYDAVGWSLIGQEALRLMGAIVLVAVGLDVTGAFFGSMVGFIFVAIALAVPLQRELERARGGVVGA